MKKKLLAGAVTLLSVAVLAACGKSTNTNQDIITMKGETITVGEFYDQVKNNQAAQQVLLNMTVTEVFEKQFGDKVSDKEVQEAYDKEAKAYGDSFAQVLAQSGLTADTYKAQIRTNKLVEYAVKKAAEKELTDENYKATFEAYTPEVTIQAIKLDSEETAKSVLDQVRAEGADFTQIAKDNTTDTATKESGGEMKFDSVTTTVPTALKKAAFGLDVNAISDVITVTDSSTYSTSYYVVKMISKSEKAAKWEDMKDKLKEIILAQKQADTSFIQGVVSQALQKANIKVKDATFQSLFAQYISSSNTSSSSTEASTSTEESSK